jgi:PPOX class probable F420-dependent enzyme
LPEAIEGHARELLEAKNFGTISTVSADGSPLSVVVWIDTDGEHILFNSAQGRAWVRNLERDDRASCLVQNLENPYEWVQFRGRVEVTQDGADEHIDALANKYTGEDYAYRQPDEVRLKFRLAPEKVSSYGF